MYSGIFGYGYYDEDPYLEQLRREEEENEEDIFDLADDAYDELQVSRYK